MDSIYLAISFLVGFIKKGPIGTVISMKLKRLVFLLISYQGCYFEQMDRIRFQQR